MKPGTLQLNGFTATRTKEDGSLEMGYLTTDSDGTVRFKLGYPYELPAKSASNEDEP